MILVFNKFKFTSRNKEIAPFLEEFLRAQPFKSFAESYAILPNEEFKEKNPFFGISKQIQDKDFKFTYVPQDGYESRECRFSVPPLHMEEKEKERLGVNVKGYCYMNFPELKEEDFEKIPDRDIELPGHAKKVKNFLATLKKDPTSVEESEDLKVFTKKKLMGVSKISMEKMDEDLPVESELQNTLQMLLKESAEGSEVSSENSELTVDGQRTRESVLKILSTAFVKNTKEEIKTGTSEDFSPSNDSHKCASTSTENFLTRESEKKVINEPPLDVADDELVFMYVEIIDDILNDKLSIGNNSGLRRIEQAKSYFSYKKARIVFSEILRGLLINVKNNSLFFSLVPSSHTSFLGTCFRPVFHLHGKACVGLDPLLLDESE